MIHTHYELCFPVALKQKTEIVTKHIPGFLDTLYDAEAFNAIRKEELRDAFHTNQILSKTWFLEKFLAKGMPKEVRILLIGSWLGFFTYVLRQYGYRNVHEVDSDLRMLGISPKANPGVVHYTTDVNEFSKRPEYQEYQLIINLSCEHIPDNTWFKNIKSETSIWLQSNDFVIPEHTNICISLEDMKQKYPIVIALEGELRLPIYNRYMLIGHKY